MHRQHGRRGHNKKRFGLLAALAALLLVVAGCDGAADGAGKSPAAKLEVSFPKDFVWGAAIAGFQVDMGCPTLPASACDDPNSDWYQWITDPGLQKEQITHLAGDPPSAGPGFWELWPQYMDGMRADMGLGALRYSVEWSRLFPKAAAATANTVDELAQHVHEPTRQAYHQIFAGARQRKIKLLITLNHYTLPLWMHDGKACHDNLTFCETRGWLDRDKMLKHIALFSGYVAREYGAEVDLWGTINEPFAVALAGYLSPGPDRTNPPGVFGAIEEGISVVFHMMEAHCRMYDAVHTEDKVDADGDGVAASVGIVANLAAVAPSDPNNPQHVALVPHADYVYNRVFLNAITKGEMDRNLDGVIEVAEKHDDMVGRLDFLGVNYYTQLKIGPQPFPLAPQYKLFDFLPDTNLFSNYPQGLYEVSKLAAEYGYPIYITENGTGDNKQTSWQNFVQPHLLWLHKAISEGVLVKGYFYWTLMDNYEWNHGVHVFKMGLYDVDFVTKKFTLSPMGRKYGEAARAGGW